MQGLNELFHVRGWWYPSQFCNCLVVNVPQCMCRLECCHSSSHVSFGKLQNRIQMRIGYGAAFTLSNVGQTLLHTLWREGLESELGATRSQRFNHPGHIVTNQNEPSNSRVGFNNSSKCSLGIFGDSICLIQDDNLEGWIGILLLVFVVHLFRLFRFWTAKEVTLGWYSGLPHRKSCKMLDFVTDHRDSTFITGIQFQNAFPPLRRVPKLSAQCQCHGGLSTSGRPIKQQMRETTSRDRILKG
mmetsp:Transcript_39741/g.95987  ORF Transcript_39741/g.95987 Transcript_39741/m.95987 type:complete len:243 (+) Transcript_39741:298-1026(+)